MSEVNTAKVTQALEFDGVERVYRAKVQFRGEHYTREYEISIKDTDPKKAQVALKKIVAEIANQKFTSQRDFTYKEENEISLGRKLATWDSKARRPRFFHSIKVQYDVHVLKTEGIDSRHVGSAVKQARQMLRQARAVPKTLEASVAKVYVKAVGKPSLGGEKLQGTLKERQTAKERLLVAKKGLVRLENSMRRKMKFEENKWEERSKGKQEKKRILTSDQEKHVKEKISDFMEKKSEAKKAQSAATSESNKGTKAQKSRFDPRKGGYYKRKV